jgi:extracellular elastinolytic metalloproteinase
MPRERDTRDFSKITYSNFDAEKKLSSLAAESLSAGQQVDISRVNPFTGTARVLDVEKAPPMKGSLIQQALDYVTTEAKSAVGFQSGEQPEFIPDAYAQETSGNKAIVTLHQTYRGIPIFSMNRTVKFKDRNTIDEVEGNTISITEDLDTVPKIGAVTAVKIAAAYLSQTDEEKTDHWGQTYTLEKLEVPPNYEPQVLSKFDSPSQPTTIAKGPFGEAIKAILNFFDQGSRIRLVWNLTATMADHTAQYLMFIAADQPWTPTLEAADFVLWCKDVSSSQGSVLGNVFTHNPGVAQRQTVTFPMAASMYPLAGGQLPTPFPKGWWVDKDETVGNCTIAVTGNTTNTLKAAANGAGLLFDPAQSTDDDQKLLNIFYFCNYMHDFLYMLGFDEQAGNFQTIDFTGLGSGNDAVRAHAHPGKVRGTANMLTPPDGQAPTMNMGLVALPDKHTAFDSDVVFHEYCHGLSNRLVGGRVNSQALVEPQSRGMGEGWSDYFALTIQNHGKTTEKTVTGDWVIGRPGGIRSAPYDANYPNKFGDLSKFVDEHDVGEVWCAALMQMNRELGKVFGDKEKGHEVGWQIVVDGMKLVAANPSFLDARDGILTALQDLDTAAKLPAGSFAKARRAVWEAFAMFGMGANAQTNGPFLKGVVGDSSIPPGV